MNFDIDAAKGTLKEELFNNKISLEDYASRLEQLLVRHAVMMKVFYHDLIAPLCALILFEVWCSL